MELFKAIKTRRSIRTYLKKKIPKKDLEKIIEAGTSAPSACNQQLWNFIVVENKKIKKRLVEEAGSTGLVLKSPITIVVTYHKENIEEGFQSASAAVQNMLLAATSLGIGSLWVNSTGDKKKVKEILEIPDDFFIVCFVLLGYSDEKIKIAPPRKKLEEVVHFNKFQQKNKNKFSHNSDRWEMDEIRKYQKYFSRKTSLGTKMDVFSQYETKLIRHLFKNEKETLDLFSYDGSLIDYLPVKKIYSVNLCKQAAMYTKKATDKKIKSIEYDKKIKLKANNVRAAGCLFKLERIPKKEWENIFKETKRILKKGGKFQVVFRNRNPFYLFFYFLLKKRLGDDIRKTGIYSFFGPYKPLKTKEVVETLKTAGFKIEKIQKFFPIPPIFEEIYQNYLQYKISKGSSFLHKKERKNLKTSILKKIISKKIRKNPFGSVSVVTVRK